MRAPKAPRLGEDYDESVTITVPNTPAVVFLSAGALPTGMSLSYDDDTFTISGTASGEGTYTFTIHVEDVDGNYTEKGFTINVARIATTTLADGETGQDYSETLFYSGPVDGAVNWTVISGSLPPGLSLNPATGVISGTPTTDGLYAFTVQMEDGH